MACRKNTIGLLVVGHGTRHDQGKQDFWTTVEHVAEELPNTVVEGCFLEAGTPDISTALHAMARRELSEVVLAPLLLFSAGHAQRDIPAAALQAAADARLTVRQVDVLGCHPQILALSAARFRSAVGAPYAPEEVLWLFVGRGSSDAAATAEMDRFAAGRLALTPVGRAVVAFLAMAEPRVEAVVPRIAAMDFATVVVQPHLLYPGTLLSRLQRIVAVQDRNPRRQHWILADCLGCDRVMARVVAERFREATAVG
jgi:sirohydrochlorin cobaltochelatase